MGEFLELVSKVYDDLMYFPFLLSIISEALSLCLSAPPKIILH